MAEGIMDIDDGNFESEVLQSDKPVLVDLGTLVRSLQSHRTGSTRSRQYIW